jgi:hypothetical protein
MVLIFAIKNLNEINKIVIYLVLISKINYKKNDVNIITDLLILLLIPKLISYFCINYLFILAQ